MVDIAEGVGEDDDEDGKVTNTTPASHFLLTMQESSSSYTLAAHILFNAGNSAISWNFSPGKKLRLSYCELRIYCDNSRASEPCPNGNRISPTVLILTVTTVAFMLLPLWPCALMIVV